MDEGVFKRQLELALANLRDVVYLRTTDLAASLLPDVPRSDRGWGLSRLLLDALERLRPPRDEHDDWPRRRYEILTLRYVNGLSPEEVADRLVCSRRHFYRQLQRALDEFAEFLWAEMPDNLRQPEPTPAPADPAPGTTGQEHLSLLRQEVALLRESRHNCSLVEVWQSVLAVVSPLVERQQVTLQADFPARLPEVSLSPQILKQFLLGVLDELLRGDGVSGITLEARPAPDRSAIVVSIGVSALPGEPKHWSGAAAVEGIRKRVSSQLAAMHGIAMELPDPASEGQTFRIELPAARARTVLVIEDNDEVCLLLQRYLSSGGYRSVVARTGREAIARAKSYDLYAVTLDLMMTDEDGWDILQALRHDPQTSSLPIIVCTVLDHRELALALGASAFLKKPVMREQLLQTLADLSPS